MPKGLVPELQRKQQLCILLLYDLLARQSDYATQHKGSF